VCAPYFLKIVIPLLELLQVLISSEAHTPRPSQVFVSPPLVAGRASCLAFSCRGAEREPCSSGANCLWLREDPHAGAREKPFGLLSKQICCSLVAVKEAHRNPRYFACQTTSDFESIVSGCATAVRVLLIPGSLAVTPRPTLAWTCLSTRRARKTGSGQDALGHAVAVNPCDHGTLIRDKHYRPWPRRGGLRRQPASRGSLGNSWTPVVSHSWLNR
jgi:hypothetical protein